MALPTIQGVIRRRILVNYRVDPSLMQSLLPAPFRPKLLGDAALAGICLIRLEQLRPQPLPAALGMTSENAAHRVAVEWTGPHGEPREGVYIPRRDSNSIVNYLVGGRLFPGEHHRAQFSIVDEAGAIELSMHSLDREVAVEVRGKRSASLPPGSRFGSLQEASDFFERGAVGYSERAQPSGLDGVCLVTRAWRLEPLEVERVFSSFFADPKVFPKGSVEFDCALVMRDIEHVWQRVPSLPPGRV